MLRKYWLSGLIVLLLLGGFLAVGSQWVVKADWAQCKQILFGYGGSGIDLNGDGKVNALDCLAEPRFLVLKVSDIDGTLTNSVATPGVLIVQISEPNKVVELQNLPYVDSATVFAQFPEAKLYYVKVVLKDVSYISTINAYLNLASMSVQSNSNIKDVIPNWIATPRREPISNPDPLYNKQWNLKAVNVQSAWDIVTGTRDDSDIFATVIDTGVELNHEDLQSNLNGNYIEWKGLDRVDDDENGLIDDIDGASLTDTLQWDANPQYFLCGQQSHGTEVSWFAAEGNNGIGLTGINWKSRVYHINDVDIANSKCAATTQTILLSFSLATTLDSPVINYSSGFDCSAGEGIENCKKRYRWLSRAIDAATLGQNGNIETILVNAVTNTSRNIDLSGDIPCSYGDENPAIICVTATQLIDGKEYFGQNYGYGRSVHLAAPGVKIVVPSYDLLPYTTANGTSFAAPHVTGAILLMLQAATENDVSLTLGQVKSILAVTVDTKDTVPSFALVNNLADPSLALEDKVKYGRLNVGNAVACAADPDLGCLNTQPTDVRDWHLDVTGVKKAHEIVDGVDDDKDLVVGVLGDGVDLEQEDLQGQLEGNISELRGSGGFDDEGNGVTDDVHGVRVRQDLTMHNNPGADPRCDTKTTEAIGVMAARGNDKGIDGLLKQASVLTANYTHFNPDNGKCEGDGNQLVEGIKYLRDAGAPVMLMTESVICYDDLEPDGCRETYAELKLNLRRFTHDSSGIIKGLVIAPIPDKVNPASTALGINFEEENVLHPVPIPCAFRTDNPAIICVASTRLDNDASELERFAPEFSNWGFTDLAAPGVRITTTTEEPENYKIASGNMLAASQVAGAALLVKEANRDLSMEKIRDILFNTVDTRHEIPSFAKSFWEQRLPYNDRYGLEDKVATGGRLNVDRAVKCAKDLHCLTGEFGTYLPIVVKHQTEIVRSNLPVMIYFQPGIEGTGILRNPGMTEIAAKMMELLMARGYKGPATNNFRIPVKDMLREYLSFDHAVRDMHGYFCHYLGTECTRDVVAQAMLEDAKTNIVISLGHSAGAEMNALLATEYPELATNPNVYFISFGAPSFVDSELTNAEQLAAISNGRFYYYEHPGDEIAVTNPWTLAMLAILKTMFLEGYDGFPAHYYHWESFTGGGETIDFIPGVRDGVTGFINRHFPTVALVN